MLVAALLLAGIAQSAHWHKSELVSGTPDVHCLLCVYAGGSAPPPAPLQPPGLPARQLWGMHLTAAPALPLSGPGGPYQARAPPLV